MAKRAKKTKPIAEALPVETVETVQEVQPVFDPNKPYGLCSEAGKPDWFEQDGRKFSISAPHKEL